MPYAHAEVEAAIRGLSEAFKEAERRGSWSWLADEFYHEDCVYTCPYGGTMLVVANGREEIRRTHYGRDMEVGAAWKGWSFPIFDWGINGDRIISRWANRGPGRRPDGSYYETQGVSFITYGGRRKVLLAVRSLRHGAPDATLRRARGGGPARPEAEIRLGHPDEASPDRHASARVAAGLRYGRFVPRSASHREEFMTEQLFPAGAVLVVGGSGGVGQAVCLEFARAGSDVALTYHSKRDNAEKVAEKIRALGRKVSVHQLTIGDAAQVDAVVEAAAKEHGRLHTVVVGAGTLAEQVLISEMSRKQWQTVIDQDLNGFFNVVQATLPRLREWGGGSYVHLGSAGHLQWPPRDVMSVAPKAAIEALITGIAKEEGRYNIRANTVLLGVIEAGMFLELTKQGVFDAKWVEEVQKNLALKRWGKT